VPWQQAAACPACRATPPEWVALRSVYQYGGPLREALHAFKFERRTHLYRPLGLDLARLAEREGWAWDALAAVPMTDKALRQRGHNPAFLLARGLARALGVPGPDARALGKCRETAPQRSLGAAERQANVKGAFEAQAARVSGRRVLLVDDVVTTGATLGACARALLQAGATEVRALTLARRVLE
jgi:ComF family protein